MISKGIDLKKKLAEVKSAKQYRGRKELIAFLEGKPLTRAQSQVAKCFDCQGYFADGISKCPSIDCPMQEYYPYKNEKDVVDKPKRVLTPEHIAAIKAGREKKK